MYYNHREKREIAVVELIPGTKILAKKYCKRRNITNFSEFVRQAIKLILKIEEQDNANMER
jgi:hypothetical protein